MPIACVLIPHLPYRAEAARQPQLRGRDAIIAVSTGSRRAVLDFHPEGNGLAAGMPLQEALSRLREAVLLEADLPNYEAIFETILDALEGVSPLVEGAELGCAYVDLRGLEGIYSGEEGTMDALLRAVPPAFAPQVGVAAGKFPAYLAAAQAHPGQALRVGRDLQGFLASLPVAALPLSWKTRERLRGFGLKSLGDLAALPLGPLQTQFGRDGALAWRLARGQDERLLVPRRHQEAIRESLTFPAPTAALEAILLALESLLGRAFSCPQLRGRFVRAATLEGRIPHATPWRRRVAFRGSRGG